MFARTRHKALAIALLGFVIFGSSRGDVVIHTAADASGGTIFLTVGTMATIDLFVSSNAMDTNLLGGVVLNMEIHESGGGLANASLAPVFGAIEFDDADMLFTGGNGSVDSPSDGVQKIKDWSISTNQDIAATNVGGSAIKFASIVLDADSAQAGTYHLIFNVSAAVDDDTKFTQIGGGPFVPMINNGGASPVPVSTGLTIVVTAVPEPNAFLLVGLVCMVGFAARRIQSTRAK